MFQAKGCPVFGSSEVSVAAALDKIKQEKVIVFDISSGGVEGAGDAKVVKTKLDEDNFSQGVETILATLSTENDKTQSVFVSEAANPQDITSGMVAACAIKAINTIRKMKSMVEDGITEKEWTNQLIRKSFEDVSGDPKVESYDVVTALVEKLGEGATVGKILADKMINLCEGKVNLRKCIQETKEKYDVSAENKQIKLQCIASLERYFYLVCFCTYLRVEYEAGTTKSFTEWLKEKVFLPDMIKNGIRIWQDMTFFTLTTGKAVCA